MSGALFAWIGGAIQPGASGALSGGQIAAKIAVHAVAGGLINSAFGGDFRSGALAAGFGAAIGSIKGLQITKSSSIGKIISVGVIRTVAGGIGAELGGGKFVNGAATAAFAYLFNDLAHAYPENGRMSESASYKQTLKDGRKAGDYYAIGRCGDDCIVQEWGHELRQISAEEASKINHTISKLYDKAVAIGGEVMGHALHIPPKHELALDIAGIDIGESMFKFGLGEKPPALSGGDQILRTTAVGANSSGTYTQVLSKEYKGELWYRFRYE